MSEYNRCQSCGRLCHDYEGVWFDGWGFYCHKCCDKCSDCGEYFLPHSLTDFNGEIWCRECLEKEAERLEEEQWDGMRKMSGKSKPYEVDF